MAGAEVSGIAVPLVSVVVLAWECSDQLRRCLASVAAQTHDLVEVVVVDNGSTDDPRAVFDGFADRFLSARWVGLTENTGYAAGMNAGVAVAAGDYIVPMNCDALLHPKFIANALAVFRDGERCGVVAPLVVRVSPDDPLEFWRDSPRVLDGGAVGLRFQMTVVVEADVRNGRPCAKANGACPVISRESLDDVQRRFGSGPFDPIYDTYGEDIDLSLRLWSCGWATWFAPEVLAAHVRSYSSARSIRDKRGRMRVNFLAARHRNAWRHLRGCWLPFAAVAILSGDIGLAAVQLASGDRTVVSDVFAAHRRVVHEARSIWRFRRAHTTWRTIPSAHIYRRRVRGETLVRIDAGAY